MRNALFTTGLTLGFAHVAQAVAGGGSTTGAGNLFANPSFETGDLTDWTNNVANGGYAGGTVVSGAASDGSDYL